MFRIPRSRGHRVAATTVALATTILIAVGVTGAVAESKTTDVAITPLVPVKTITAATSVAAGKTYVFVASGTTSTVPTNAMVVQLAVTAKGTKAGTLSFAPLGEPGNASPTTVSWAAGGTGAGTVNVNVGVSNKVVVTNSSLAAATVGVKITGYSMQVPAAGINGSGGTNGQVLTNNGDGTVGWKAPAAVPTVFKAAVNSGGTVLFGNLTVAKVGVGSYQVTASRPLNQCAVTVAPGNYSPGADLAAAVPFSVSATANSPTASVRFYDPSIGERPTGFFVTIIC